MSNLIKCPDCGKLLNMNFPIHKCGPALKTQQVYEITRKTKKSVRFKPYGATNRAATLNMTREDFDRLFITRKDKTAIKRIN